MSTRNFVSLIGSLIERDAFIVILTGRPDVATRSHFCKTSEFSKIFNLRFKIRVWYSILSDTMNFTNIVKFGKKKIFKL
jgi:hypothetical protein